MSGTDAKTRVLNVFAMAYYFQPEVLTRVLIQTIEDRKIETTGKFAGTLNLSHRKLRNVTTCGTRPAGGGPRI